MSDDGFNGRRVLVTGATGGIGNRVCRTLGEQGAEVYLVGRDATALAVLESEVNPRESTRCRAFVVDFASSTSTARCATAIGNSECAFDGIVVIVPSVPKSIELLPAPDDWRVALDLCFVNPLAVLRSALLKARDGARVVIVSGIASVEVFPDLAFSNVIRMAWLAEAKRLSFALGRQGVRVNTLSLGGTLTERFVARLQHRRAGDVPQRESPETIPLGEYGDPDDAAYVVVSLLSRLSNHISGANVVFDGGLTRAY